MDKIFKIPRNKTMAILTKPNIRKMKSMKPSWIVVSTRLFFSPLLLLYICRAWKTTKVQNPAQNNLLRVVYKTALSLNIMSTNGICKYVLQSITHLSQHITVSSTKQTSGKKADRIFLQLSLLRLIRITNWIFTALFVLAIAGMQKMTEHRTQALHNLFLLGQRNVSKVSKKTIYECSLKETWSLSWIICSTEWIY